MAFHTFVLLCLIAILVECGDGKTELNFKSDLSLNRLRAEWGTNFRYQGMVVHNLDRVWVVTKVPIPKQSDLHLQNLSFDSHCNFVKPDLFSSTKSRRHYKESMQRLCETLKPEVDWLKKKERVYQEEIAKFFSTELYALLPGLDSLPHSGTTSAGDGSRSRRGIGLLITAVSGLITLGIEHLSGYLQNKRKVAVERAVLHMQKTQSISENMVHQFQKDFLMYGKFSVEKLSEVINMVNGLHNRTSWLERAFETNPSAWQQYYNATQEGLIVFSAHLQQYLSQMKEEHDLVYRDLLDGFRRLIVGLEKLSQGYLPAEIFPPSVLNGIIEQVKEAVDSSHPEYEVALENVANYYDMKLVTYGVDKTDHTLVVTFPILIQHHTNKQMTLFEIESVPVPISDQNREADSYSRVRIVKPYLAVNNEFYIQLRLEEMAMCKTINFNYYCEELFLVKHMATPSCESALFYDQSRELVMNSCSFEYHYNKTVVPSVLDGGDRILLANMVHPKTLECRQISYLDTPFPGHQYVTVNRSLLCNCEVGARLAYVLRSVSACSEQTGPLQFNLSLNLAFLETFKRFWNRTDRIEMPTMKHPELPVFPIRLEDPTDHPGSVVESPKDLENLLEYMEIQRNLSRQTLTERENTVMSYIMDMTKDKSGLKWLSTYTVKVLIFITLLLSSLALMFGMHMACKNKKLGTLVTGLAMGPIRGANAKIIADELASTQFTCTFPWFNYIVIPVTLIAMAICLYRQLAKLNWWRGTRFERTSTVYLFLCKGCYFVPVKILRTTAGLHVISSIGELGSDNLSLSKNLIWDVMNVDWSTIVVTIKDRPTLLPRSIPLLLKDKIRVRRMFSSKEVMKVHLMALQGKTWYNLPLKTKGTSLVHTIPEVAIDTQ